MTYRVLMECDWSPDGASLFTLRPGELVSERDPRLAKGFFEVAKQRGWVEALSQDPPAPTTARRSPAKARTSPTRAKRAAPLQKG